MAALRTSALIASAQMSHVYWFPLHGGRFSPEAPFAKGEEQIL